jgi:hypothetical protein
MKMDLKMHAVTFLLLGVIVLSTRAAKEFTQIDKLRHQILHMDDGRELQPSINGKEEALSDLVKRYKNVGDDIDRRFPKNIDQYFDVLNTVWLWARTQSEMRSIEGIYMNFRKMQHDLIDEQEGFINNQWSNFAITVLNDANASIPPALERIADFIVNQRLFVSAYKVLRGTSLQRIYLLIIRMYKSFWLIILQSLYLQIFIILVNIHPKL